MEYQCGKNTYTFFPKGNASYTNIPWWQQQAVIRLMRTMLGRSVQDKSRGFDMLQERGMQEWIR